MKPTSPDPHVIPPSPAHHQKNRIKSKTAQKQTTITDSSGVLRPKNHTDRLDGKKIMAKLKTTNEENKNA